MSSNTAPLVSIKCTVYNHEPYLRQCLDGFVMQKTNFPFEAIVHDDASTDGSAAIIREYAEKYPDIIKPIYETENQYSKKDGSLGRIMNAAIHPDAKYIAICEGDDYWINPLKLQKQVDYLESHPDYGLVCGYVDSFIQKTKTHRSIPKSNIQARTYVFSDFIRGNRVSTLTSLYRKELYLQYIEDIKPQTRGWLSGDYPMWLYFSNYSKVMVMPYLFGVYRILGESASHSNDIQKMLRLSKYRKMIREFYLERFKQDNALINEVRLISYREAQINAVQAKDVSFCSEILESYKQNGYKALYFFMKLYLSKLPFNLINFIERFCIKLKLIKSIKNY